jgi:hypothetical protein
MLKNNHLFVKSIFVIFLISISLLGLGQTTYTWNQTGTASWATAANWTPNRNTPATNDILVFDNGATTTANGMPSETIGQLLVNTNTTVNLQGAAAGVVLTIGAGITGDDFIVASSSALNINVATNTTKILIATGNTASISGNMTFSAAAHTFDAVDAAGIVFNSGATLTQGTGFSGSIFTTAGTINAVTFASGSTFIQNAGSNPFGLGIPNSKVVFQTGSNYKFQIASGTPAFNNRVYSNFEWNATGTANVIGANPSSVDDLTISQGTFNLNATGASGHSIKGNISVAASATLTFTPATATTINLNGSGTQTISNAGTITIGPNSTLRLGASSTLVMGTSSIGGTGTFTTLAGATFKTANAGGVNGSITTTTKNFNVGSNYEFNGSVNQSVGASFPATVNNLVINNTGTAGNNEVSISADVTVSNNLTLTAGLITTGANKVIIGNTAANAVVSGLGNTNYTLGWINGNIRRNFVSNTNTYDFPIGTSSAGNLMQVVNNNLTGITYIDGSIAAKAGTDVGLSIAQDGTPAFFVSSEGEWKITPDATPSGGTYDLRLYFNGFAGILDNQFSVIERPDGSSNAADWVSPAGSTHPAINAAGMTIASGYAARLGMTTFSKKGIAKHVGILPINFSNISAVEINQTMNICWATTNEKDIVYFELHRSNNGHTYHKINVQKPYTNTEQTNTYNLIDENPLMGINYYKIVAKGLNEEIMQSKIISISFGQTQQAATIHVYPNPAGSVVQFKYNLPSDRAATVTVFNMTGTQVATVMLDNNNPNHTLATTLLPNGFYFYQVVLNNTITQVGKFEVAK